MKTRMIEHVSPPLVRRLCRYSVNEDGTIHWELIAYDGTLYEGDAPDREQALGALLHTAIRLMGVSDD